MGCGVRSGGAASALVVFASACIIGVNPDYQEIAIEGETSSTADSASETQETGAGETGADETSTDGTSTGETGTGGTGTDETGTDETTGDTGTPTETIAIAPQYVACRGDADLSPDACSNYAGPARVAVELDGGPEADQQVVTCLKFPLDPAIAELPLTQVTLELHTTPGSLAGSDASGEV